MNRLLGLHLGLTNVTAVSLNGASEVADMLTIPRTQQSPSWMYTQEELSQVLEQIGQHFTMSKHVLILSLPGAGLYYRRLQLENQSNTVAVARYAIEPLVPLEIDRLHIVITDHQADSCGVIALPLDPWQEFLAMVDRAGWICPAAVADAISAWQLLGEKNSPAAGPELLCLADSQEGAIVASCAGKLLTVRPLYCSAGVGQECGQKWLQAELARTSWFCGNYDHNLVVRLLAAEQEQIYGLDFDEGVSVQTQYLRDVLPETASYSWGVFYAYCAAKSGYQKDSSCLNLRTKELRSARIIEGYRKCLLTHSVAAMVLMVIGALALWLYGQRCGDQANVYRSSCAGIWNSLFPTSPAPAEIEFRLQSELARERGLRRQNADLPEYIPALDLLRDIVASLPAGIPIQVSDVDISPSIILINGQARSHGEVEQIANQLTRIKDIKVLPASTERTSNGVVRFTIRLERKENLDVVKTA